jgi:aerobic-type carbon monoxide dehydrogenase small subunit (CoxS/CutS family)
MGPAEASTPPPRLRILHVLRDGPERSAQAIIAAQAREHEVTTVDLTAQEVSYERLVDEIFAHDRVVFW